MTYLLTFPCGATQECVSSLSTNGRRVRLAVFDSDHALAGPKLPHGPRAFCIVGCPKPRSGRKWTKCWPSDKTKKAPPYRHVVTCLARETLADLARESEGG
jgi:hypothetical protein